MTNRFSEAMKFRHACKVFDVNKKISQENFEFILEAARMSPSSFGFEPWRFLIVQNLDLREKLRKHAWGAKDSLPTCSHFVVILARREQTMRYNSEYIQHMMKNIHKLPNEAIFKRASILEKFQREDFEILNSQRTIFDWSAKQTYIALANMMNAAAYIGIDSCPIEGFEMRAITKILKENFKIDTGVFGVSSMVAFGYRINEQKVKTRQPIDDITQWFE